MPSFFLKKKTLQPTIITSTKAREICRQGVFENSYLELKELGLMKYEISRTEKLFSDEISMLYPFTIKDLEMLTILRLFDRRTFIHSLDTCITVKKKLERTLEGGFSFRDVIRTEGISDEQFERACLFHDIGKIVIPNFLLDSHYTDENWAQAFTHMPKLRMRWIIMKNKLKIPKNLLDTPEQLMDYMIKKRIRAVKFVPISKLFSKKQIRDLDARGFYDGMSLIKIIQKHEAESKRILDFMGYPIEASIAGTHHNYGNENGERKNGKIKYLVKKELLSSDILHLADIQEAMKSNRPYLMQRPILRTLAFMIDDASRGLVDCRIAYLWVKDEMNKIDPQYIEAVIKNDPSDIDHKNLQDRKEELETINKFLSEVRIIIKNSPIHVSQNSLF